MTGAGSPGGSTTGTTGARGGATAGAVAGTPRSSGTAWRARWPWWVAIGALVVGVLVLAGGTPTSQQSDEARARNVAESLKCLQCAGESVAASQAPLAQQFREEIDRQVAEGASEDQILDWFVERYGEEVLLEPPSSGLGALVWVLPVVALLAAVVGIWFAIRRWRTNPDEDLDADVRSEARPPAGSGASGVGTVAPATAREPRPAPAGAPRWRLLAVVASVLVFAVLATWLVVWGSSDRGQGELTGGTADSGGAGAGFQRCQGMAMTDPAQAVACFDDLLEENPDDVQALTYRGWAHIRADELEAGRSDLDRAVQLDPEAADPHVFLAIAASDEGEFELAAEELAAFWANDPGDVAVSVVNSEGLEREVFFGLMSAPTRDCWQAAAQNGEDRAIDQAFLDELGACLDEVLASDPGDRDARLSRALAHVGPETSDPEAARFLLESLLADDPGDADALALLVSLDLAAGDLAAAEEHLVALEELPRGPAAFLIGDAATLRAVLQEAQSSG